MRESRPRFGSLRKLMAVLAVLFIFVGVSVAVAGQAGSTRLRKPGPPTGLSLTNQGNGVLATWSAPTSDGGSPITGYVVSETAHRRSGSGPCQIPEGPTSCTLGTPAIPGERLNVKVAAVNSVGQGKYSTPVSILVADQPECTYYGPYANLDNCTLTGASLPGINFEDSSMDGANLSNADLSGDNLLSAQTDQMTLIGANLSGATGLSNFDGSNLTGANLTGAQVDVSGGGLFLDAILVNATLTDANLTDSAFSGSNLTGANLSGATMTGDNITNVTWSNTTCPDGTNSDSDSGTCANNGA